MAESLIHPTAIVDPKAEIDSGAEIGPYVIIEAGAKIASGTTLGPYVHIQGLTEIGPDNRIGTGCTIGHPPQHLGYDGDPTGVVIGRGNLIREYANINRALKEGDRTVIGNDCFLMGFSHIAHDCEIGDGVIIANGALVAGHVTVGSRAFISGNVVIHQFCRVGRLAMVGGGSRIPQDVPPFMIVEGNPACVRAVNAIGLQRAGFGPDRRRELKQIFRVLFRSDKKARAAIADVDMEPLSAEGRELVEFCSVSKRGITPGTPRV